jgi:hypothetical protein
LAYISKARSEGSVVWKILFGMLQFLGFLFSRGSFQSRGFSTSEALSAVTVVSLLDFSMSRGKEPILQFLGSLGNSVTTSQVLTSPESKGTKQASET